MSKKRQTELSEIGNDVITHQNSNTQQSTLEPHGWRARIGLILPADNVLIEPELYALRIPGVSFHAVRLTTTDHDAMRRQAVELAGAIRELGLDVVAYACAETSFNGGNGVRQTLSELIALECGVPVVTATNAKLAALKALDVRRVAVATPYKEKSGKQFEQTLRDEGVDVVSSIHRDFQITSTDSREWYATNREPSSNVYAMVRSVDRPDADAIVVASTNLSTLAVLPQMESDSGKPVVTSNQSILWWCLRTLGLDTAGLGIGRLLDLPLGTSAVSER